MRSILHGLVCVALALACASREPASSAGSAGSRGLEACEGQAGQALSVDDLLAVKESRKTVVVEGYLVKIAAGCTLMNCPDERPNCNACELDIRVAASPTHTEKTIGLFSKRFDYRCWTGSRAPCPVDAKGQKVRVRAKLHYIKEFEHASLHEPVICELTP